MLETIAEGREERAKQEWQHLADGQVFGQCPNFYAWAPLILICKTELIMSVADDAGGGGVEEEAGGVGEGGHQGERGEGT